MNEAIAIDEKLNQLERELLSLPQIICPLKHTFTKGLYSREIFMPKGTYIISETHVTQHQFAILQGSVSVWIEDVEYLLTAPFSGITEPNTRRQLYVWEDCIWATYHPTEIQPIDGTEEAKEQAVQQIGKMILKANPNWELKQGKELLQ